VLLFILNTSICAQIYTTTKVDAQVKELVSKMTLEEKVGQMTQVTIQAVSKVQGTKDQKHQLDEAKLEDAIKKYHVGSILNVYDIANTADYWHEVINKFKIR
jgi:beta-glucosidase